MFWITGLVRCVFCEHFLPVCGLSFNSVDIVFHRAEVFKLNDVQLTSSFFSGSCFSCRVSRGLTTRTPQLNGLQEAAQPALCNQRACSGEEDSSHHLTRLLGNPFRIGDE